MEGLPSLLPDDLARFGYLGLLALFLGGALILEFAGRRSAALRAAAAWVAIFGIAIAAAGWWQDRQARPVIAGDRVVTLPMGRDGHFHVTIAVNDVPVRFVVDTGASEVVLSRADARAVGIDPDALAYVGRARTANGIVGTAPVRLGRLVLGPFTDTDVRASVNRAEMDASLLGMSYLRRFARISIEGDRLVLER